MHYSLDFGNKLIIAAESFVPESELDEEAVRAVLYLSLLSCKILLKSLLEKAGFSINELKKRSHDLSSLSKDICNCELSDTEKINGKPFLGSMLLSRVVVGTERGTVGTFLNCEFIGASKYPNEIRYGELPSRFPPLQMQACAKVISKWDEY